MCASGVVDPQRAFEQCRSVPVGATYINEFTNARTRGRVVFGLSERRLKTMTKEARRKVAAKAARARWKKR